MHDAVFSSQSRRFAALLIAVVNGVFCRSAWPPFSNPGRTYKFYTGKPVLPFGYGLSYSRFIYALIPELSLSRVTLQQRALHVVGHVTVNVTNAGDVDADEVVLGFISPPTGTGRPLKQLFEFTRVHIKAGHTATGAACALVCASVCQCTLTPPCQLRCRSLPPVSASSMKRALGTTLVWCFC